MPLFDQLRGFLAEVQGEKKAAAQKKADTLSEPGSIGGETAHPVKNVDDQLQTATEGARSSENSSDVKKQIPLNVDSASDKGPDQESQQFNIGVTSTETGNDSANEDNYKDKKDDPGTTHPADVSDNEKYGSMSFDQLKKLSEKKANDILATIAAAGQKAAAAPARPTPAAPAKPAAANPAPAKTAGAAPDKNTKAAATQAAAAGYQAAADAGVAGDEQEKVAVQTAVESTIRDALAAAVMTGNYLVEFRKQAAKKQAADDEDGESSSSDSEGGSSEGGESKSKSKSDSGGGDSGGGGGEGGGGGGAPAGGGGGGGGLGLDPAALGAMAGGGGDPMAGAGGGGGQEDAVNQLLMALMEMGVSPDEILAALQGGGAGGGDPLAGAGDPMGGLGGGGGDPLAGGGDPMAGGDPLAGAGGGDPMKMARAKQAGQVRKNLVQLVKTAKAYQRQGKFRFSEAKTAAERRLRDELKKCIAEIVN